MKVHAGWLYLVVVLASASQLRAQRSVWPSIFTSTAGHLDLTEDNDALQRTHKPTDSTETPAEITTDTDEPASVFTTAAIAPVSLTQTLTSSPSENPSLSPTPPGTPTPASPEHTSSSQPVSTSLDVSPSVQGVQASTQPPSPSASSAPLTTDRSDVIAAAENPSQLNVGDEDFKGTGHRSSSLDPLLAGLLSVFTVTTAVVFVVLFLKFRHQNSHPEFHRLQDLPMDDLLEDTPLSRYTY